MVQGEFPEGSYSPGDIAEKELGRRHPPTAATPVSKVDLHDEKDRDEAPRDRDPEQPPGEPDDEL